MAPAGRRTTKGDVMPHPAPFLDLIVVVSGSPHPVRVDIHQTLEHVVAEALRESGNVGQPPADWELRTEDGMLLNQATRVDAAGLREGQTLFLSPRAGAGG
ncbi:MAG TPA: DUF2604 domain-containing protein [Streptosporangiaceae bacterium]|nr:DUF2604 domain-containing protein [Streptosporangiaceae bacterium]